MAATTLSNDKSVSVVPLLVLVVGAAIGILPPFLGIILPKILGLDEFSEAVRWFMVDSQYSAVIICSSGVSLVMMVVGGILHLIPSSR